MRIDNFYHKMVISLLIYFVCSYFGLFAGYYAANVFLACLILLIIFFLVMQKIELVKISNFPVVWQLLLIYLTFNALLNLPSSILYLIAFFAGLLVLCLKSDERDYQVIIKYLQLISITLAFSIYLQAFIPDVFYDIAKLWFFYSNQYELVHYTGNVVHQFSGAFYEVSFSAFVLSIGYSIIFCKMLLHKSIKNKNLIYLIIVYGAIILTGKRSFILLLPAVSLYVFLLHNGIRLTISRIIVYLIMIVVFIVNFIQFQEVILGVLGKGDADVIELSSREYFWRIAIDMIEESPVVGGGLNSYDANFNNSGIRDMQYSFAGAHNSYIQIFAETGIIGAILFAYAIYKTYACAFKNMYYYKLTRGYYKYFLNLFAIFSLTNILLYSVTGNVFYQPQQLIFFFLLSNIIYHTKIRKEVEHEDTSSCG